MTREQMKSHFIVHTNGQDEWIKVDKRTYDKSIDMFCDAHEAEIKELRSTIKLSKFSGLLPKRPKWEENIIKTIKSSTPTKVYSSKYEVLLSYGTFKIHLESNKWAGWSMEILDHPETYPSNRTKKIILSYLVNNGYVFKRVGFKHFLQWAAIGSALIFWYSCWHSN